MYLPLTNNPEESFNIVIFGQLYTIRQLWNVSGEFWTLDFFDSDGVVLVYGVKIVTQGLLLNQYPQIPFDLISSADVDASRDDLNEFNLEIIEKYV